MSKLIFFTISLLGLSLGINAQTTAVATVSATIASPITISKNADGIGGGGRGGTSSSTSTSTDAPSDAVVEAAAINATANAAASTAAGIDPATTTTGVKLAKNAETISVVAFTVTGSEASSLSISLAQSVTLTRSGGEETITANLSTSNISSTGSQTIVISASLPSASSQTGGNYSGTFHFTGNNN
jgi:hypothetical protein